MNKPKLVRHPNIKTKILPDGYVLLHVPNVNWVYTLTALGGVVWEFCDGTNDCDEIINLIGQLEQVQLNETLAAEITKMVDDLLAADLLTAADPAIGLPAVAVATV